jgi:hypothetical protein
MTLHRERRRHRRLRIPVECQVPGESGVRRSRIGDLALGGCFVETPLTFVVGTPLTLVLGPNAAGLPSLSGTVVGVQPGIGFSVRFDPLDEDTRARLLVLLNASAAGPDERP